MLRVGFVFLVLAVGVAVVGVVSGALGGLARSKPVIEPLPRVAHAGGGVDGVKYTNSREAIVESLGRGFEWVEIDFAWTTDGVLVCMHGWGNNFRRLFERESADPVSLEEFKRDREGKRFRFLTLYDLAGVMEEYPKLKIVTDVKDNNLAALEVMADVLPDASERVIPQVYLPEEYEPTRLLGYEKIIWTLYNYDKQRDIDRVVAEMTGRDFAAICLSRERVKDGHAKRLAEFGVSTFAHTINDPEEWADLRENWGVTQVYTDFLPAGDKE